VITGGQSCCQWPFAEEENPAISTCFWDTGDENVSCTTPDDCLSQHCTSNKCQQSSYAGYCLSNTDCLPGSQCWTYTSGNTDPDAFQCYLQTGQTTCIVGGDCISGACSGTPKTCQSGGFGGGCFTNYDCSSTYECDLTSQTCVATGANTTYTCSSDSQCGSGYCNSASPRRCVPNTTQGGSGPCITTADCPSTGGWECYENGGVCLLPAGKACTTAAQCQSGACTANVCGCVGDADGCVSAADCCAAAPYCNLADAELGGGTGFCFTAPFTGFESVGGDNECAQSMTINVGSNNCVPDGG
jgi:hypothetical protein